MESQPAAKWKALFSLVIQVAIIGGVAGYLSAIHETWARYSLVGLFVILAGKMVWDLSKVRRRSQ